MTANKPFLRFSDDAQKIFETWLMDLQSRLEDEDLHPAIISHLAKYRSLMPSLALIFHLLEYADGGPAGPVSEKAALMACAWCQYLESHARRLYALALDNGTMAAAALSKKIEGGKLESPFKVRTVQQKGWGRLTSNEEIKEAVAILEENDWVRAVAVQAKGVGRPQEATYQINVSFLNLVVN